MRTIFLSLLAAGCFFSSCTQNAITGRSQLQLLPESDLQSMAKSEYQTFLSQNKVVATTVSKDAEMVKRVGSRIAAAITDYYTKENKGSVLQGYQWEFNLVDSKEVNAWCMPGGKVVVYTGLLPITQNEAALAVVMGHEIAHAIAQQNESDPLFCWLHACLHKIEGDQGNSRYWYAKAGRRFEDFAKTDDELRAILASLT